MRSALCAVLLFSPYVGAQNFIAPIDKQMVANERAFDIYNDYIIVPKECAEIFFQKMLKYPQLKDDGEDLLWRIRNCPDNEPVYVFPVVWNNIQRVVSYAEAEEREKGKVGFRRRKLDP